MSAPSSEDLTMEVEPGDILAGKYRVEKLLGAGGMGVVVQATHVVLNDRVALKFLLPAVAKHETTAARFLREAQAAVRIKSPHVARVIDVGTIEETGSPYMVMEYLEGKDLSDIIEQEGPLDVGLAVLYALQVCEALAAAHTAGVVHRDIKPANIFLTRAGDGSPVAKVLDFGISKVAADMGISSLTQTQVSMGSPLYMSPEQMRSARTVDSRADIWSLGVVLYEALTGTLPFMADSMPQLCALVLENTAPPIRLARPDIPEELERAIARCLEKEPSERYQSVGELARDIGPFAGDLGVSSADRVSRILDSIGTSRTVSNMQAPRPSMASIQEEITGKHATSTAFGTTGVPQKERDVRPYVAVAVLGLGLVGVTLWGINRGANDVAPAAAPPIEAPAVTSATEPTEPAPTTEPVKEEPEVVAAPASASAAPSAEPKAAAQQPSEADKRAWAKRAKPKPKPKPEPEKPKPEKPKPGVFDDRL